MNAKLAQRITSQRRKKFLTGACLFSAGRHVPIYVYYHPSRPGVLLLRLYRGRTYYALDIAATLKLAILRERDALRSKK